MLLSIIQGILKTKQTSKQTSKQKQITTELAQKAKAGNQEVLNDLLFSYTPFMKKTASFVCKRPIDEQDEEFSVAMNGFHEAIMSFNPEENASLQTYAHLIIKRRIIDYIRKESARNEKISYIHTSREDASTEHQLLDEKAIHTYSIEQQSIARKEELIHYTQLLGKFGLSFEELTQVAPKHADARRTAFQTAQIIAETEEFYDFLIRHKRLPLKDIEAIVEVSRKTLERQRKYLIAVVLLLKSDFVYIKEYVKGEIV
ncbi:RNA polymerase sigma-I factor [Psychrobacillus glaciei]|uniref:RNA polymerase sigma factor SigI n=1 Tax=Psychrobacillus glaciei TaxID=2283160 RepID=A0A5J6SJW9_9BACI|nr:RNA polymerase sigma-I factor [Psychrobacillus glaciei]QFF97969.1 RNA polymerase sigma-I factor [Psychrobacillus glaciei]